MGVRRRTAASRQRIMVEVKVMCCNGVVVDWINVHRAQQRAKTPDIHITGVDWN